MTLSACLSARVNLVFWRVPRWPLSHLPSSPRVLVATGHRAGRLHGEGPQHVCSVWGRPEGDLQALLSVHHHRNDAEKQTRDAHRRAAGDKRWVSPAVCANFTREGTLNGSHDSMSKRGSVRIKYSYTHCEYWFCSVALYPSPFSDLEK